jgi:hypothetical protein
MDGWMDGWTGGPTRKAHTQRERDRYLALDPGHGPRHGHAELRSDQLHFFFNIQSQSKTVSTDQAEVGFSSFDGLSLSSTSVVTVIEIPSLFSSLFLFFSVCTTSCPLTYILAEKCIWYA